MIIENMYQAKANLSRLVDKAIGGEDVIRFSVSGPWTLF